MQGGLIRSMLTAKQLLHNPITTTRPEIDCHRRGNLRSAVASRTGLSSLRD